MRGTFELGMPKAVAMVDASMAEMAAAMAAVTVAATPPSRLGEGRLCVRRGLWFEYRDALPQRGEFGEQSGAFHEASLELRPYHSLEPMSFSRL